MLREQEEALLLERGRSYNSYNFVQVDVLEQETTKNVAPEPVRTSNSLRPGTTFGCGPTATIESTLQKELE